MKTSLEVAREEAARARSNAERAQAAATHAEELVDPAAEVPSGIVVMAVAAAHCASLAAVAASEAAAHALSVAESEARAELSQSFKSACLAVSRSLRAAIEATQAATAALGVASTLPATSAPHASEGEPAAHGEKRCAFCGRTEDSVRLVAGPQVYICEECVKACAQLLGFGLHA